MKSVLIDGKNLSLREGTGIATYSRTLCDAYNEIGIRTNVLYGENTAPASSDIELEVDFFDCPQEMKWHRRARAYFGYVSGAIVGVEPFEIPESDTVIRTQFSTRLPQAHHLFNATRLFRLSDLKYGLTKRYTNVGNHMGADVAHWTSPMPVRLRGAKNIYTIHDLVPLRLPFTTLDKKKYFLRLLRAIARDADLLITVSEHSKRDIVTLLDVDPDRVVNTYQAVEIPSKFTQSSSGELSGLLSSYYGIEKGNYILFYGAIEPKKNVSRLVEAYLSSGIDIPLLLVGKDGWLVDDEMRPLSGAEIHYLQTDGAVTREKSSVRRINYVSFGQLVSLIRGARFVAFPSLYEGFGLPIVESMLCGVPVLTSNLGAMKEIAGDGAVLVDPYDVRSIMAGMKALCDDGNLREEMTAKGKGRSATFSMEAYTEKLKAVKERLA